MEPLYMPMSPDEQSEAIKRAIAAVQSGKTQQPQPMVPNPVLNAIPSDAPPPSYGNAPTTTQAITQALQGDEQKKQLDDLFDPSKLRE